MQSLVSILVPIYNVQDYIERCARSLFEQTYNNCEFIFVNDCTKDNSVLILKKNYRVLSTFVRESSNYKS